MIKIKVQIYDMALAVLFSNLGSIKAKAYITGIRDFTCIKNKQRYYMVTADSKGTYHVDENAIHYMKQLHTYTNTHT